MAGLAISAACLVAIVVWAAKQPAPELPSNASGLALVAGAIGLYGVATAIRGERWLRLMRHDGAHPARTDAYGLTVVGYMGNNVLPARAGDAMRVYLQAPRAQTGMRSVIGTIVAERVLDALTLLTLFVVMGYGVLRGIDTPEAGALLAAMGIGLAVAAVLALGAYALRDHDRVRRLVAFVAPMADATRDLLSRHGGTMLLITLAIWGFEAATYLVVGYAVDLEMSPGEALYIVALASLFVLIPSGPGYVGTLDAALIFGATAIGASGAVVVSFLLALRFVLLIPITVAGLVLLLVHYGGWRAAPALFSRGSA